MSAYLDGEHKDEIVKDVIKRVRDTLRDTPIVMITFTELRLEEIVGTPVYTFEGRFYFNVRKEK